MKTHQLISSFLVLGQHTVSVALLEFLCQPQNRLGTHLCAKVSVEGRWSATLKSIKDSQGVLLIRYCNIDVVLGFGSDALQTCCMWPRTFLRQSKTPLPSSEYRLKMKSVV